jgi:hypothetical protein
MRTLLNAADYSAAGFATLSCTAAAPNNYKQALRMLPALPTWGSCRCQQTALIAAVIRNDALPQRHLLQQLLPLQLFQQSHTGGI